jgi:hypothetical protein
MSCAARKLTGIAVAALISLAATPVRAQVSTNARVSNLAANAAIGAVLAAARSVFGGRGLTRPVLLGAVGGACRARVASGNWVLQSVNGATLPTSYVLLSSTFSVGERSGVPSRGWMAAALAILGT